MTADRLFLINSIVPSVLEEDLENGTKILHKGKKPKALWENGLLIYRLKEFIIREALC